MASTKPTTQKVQEGTIVSIAGPVVNVYFEGELPSIYEALLVEMPDGKTLTLEVEFETGGSEVKALAFGSTDGLARGMKAKRTFAAISVPVGDKTLGRIFNVLGHAIDGQKFDDKGVALHPIHANPPELVDQETKPVS